MKTEPPGYMVVNQTNRENYIYAKLHKNFRTIILDFFLAPEGAKHAMITTVSRTGWLYFWKIYKIFPPKNLRILKIFTTNRKRKFSVFQNLNSHKTFDFDHIFLDFFCSEIGILI